MVLKKHRLTDRHFLKWIYAILPAKDTSNNTQYVPNVYAVEYSDICISVRMCKICQEYSRTYVVSSVVHSLRAMGQKVQRQPRAPKVWAKKTLDVQTKFPRKSPKLDTKQPSLSPHDGTAPKRTAFCYPIRCVTGNQPTLYCCLLVLGHSTLFRTAPHPILVCF